MADKFITFLQKAELDVKKFFANPIVGDAVQDGLLVGEVLDPALIPLFQGISKAYGMAQTLANAANPTGDTTTQVAALTLANAQTVFNTYCASTNTTIETPQQAAIVKQLLALLAELPSPVVAAAPAVAVAAPVVAVAAPAVAVAAPAVATPAVAETVAPAPAVAPVSFSASLAPVPLAQLAAHLSVSAGPGLSAVSPA